jgi:riboflavin kinase/FMN adenylyltransferase
MPIVNDPAEIAGALAKGTSLTIGNFDGVHLGHNHLLRVVMDRAAQHGLTSLAVTFDPHPLRVIRGHTPPFLTPTRQKLELLKAQGLDYVLCLEFTQDMARLSPEDFVHSYLVRQLKCRYLVIGHDYTFGRGGAGNYDTLLELGQKHGFSTERIEALTINGEVVSSTRIRELIQQGRVDEAKPLLGRHFQVEGTVVEGSRRGGPILNVPTANLEVAQELVPKPGVYAVRAEHKGVSLPGVANVGHNPTFNQKALSVEVHLFQFSGDLYGEHLRVAFVSRLRGEIRFSGVEELKEQIHRDIREGKRLLLEDGPDDEPNGGGSYAAE